MPCVSAGGGPINVSSAGAVPGNATLSPTKETDPSYRHSVPFTIKRLH